MNSNEIKEPTATVSAFGYELIRDVLIPDILGKDTSSILYWAGKSLARKYPLESHDQIIDFFQKAGWGTLIFENELKNELECELTGEYITRRLKENQEAHFQLEAGFLAQQIEMQRNVISEAYEHPKKRSKKVTFTVKWDNKDHLG
ncbi:YslB family protein (plasmid) [Bacillus sp. 31A1R]|uniref:YslB family protein n=1 Tax=Robertmurraya mangrovi TaxID=3098077 RepID=A0ABU5IUD3_9BACI|nr:YslB family protein [Bacillus sp. 31A1R]MDZ5470755.1 YslB family protein [Bacillus sp. 31A1R]